MTEWNGPWNSALKLHAAGFLIYYDGSLVNRGSWGFYWSIHQEDNTNGLNMHLSDNASFVTGNNKAGGHSIRCIRE